MTQNKTKLYKDTQIKTTSPIKLVIMLYDAAIQKTEAAIENMDFKTYDVVNKNLIKVGEIIEELLVSLNMKKGGDVSHNLKEIYLYLTQRVNEGNVNKNIEPLKECLKILKELRKSWIEVSKVGHSGKVIMNKSTSSMMGGLDIKG